jgi:hypothetical protein
MVFFPTPNRLVDLSFIQLKKQNRRRSRRQLECPSVSFYVSFSSASRNTGSDIWPGRAVAALATAQVIAAFSYASTGGEASGEFLERLEGKKLPGVEAFKASRLDLIEIKEIEPATAAICLLSLRNRGLQTAFAVRACRKHATGRRGR